MFCPLHRCPVLHGKNDGKCLLCEKAGIKAEAIEIDKWDRAVSTLLEQGYEIDFHYSHAVLVYKLKSTPASQGA